MKLTAILLTVAFLQVHAKSISQVTISVRNASVEKVFRQIERQTGVGFIYTRGMLSNLPPVTLSVNNASVKEVLDECFRNGNLEYTIDNKVIVITRKVVPRSVKPLVGITPLPAPPPVEIRGKVVNAQGQPIANVSVIISGTSIGTTTNADGHFSITAPDNRNISLDFSSVGFMPKKVSVGSRTEVDVVLEQDVSGLNEVVVVGYGTQKRKDLTGSISSVTNEQIAGLPVSDFESALKGQAAGVQVYQNTGSPSAGVTVKIRGANSITAGNDPLYVVDGIPLSGGGGGLGNIPGGANPLNNINPSDIQSIDILKDASATAIYGSRGANGVVIITTKTGNSGKPQLKLDIYNGWQKTTKKLDVLSPEEFAEYYIESRNNGWLQSGGDPNTPNEKRGKYRVPPVYLNPELGDPTNWQDEIFRTGRIQNYNIMAMGGSDKFHYAISGGYFENQGILIQSFMRRYAFRMNLDAKLNEKVSIGLKLSPSYTINNQQNTEGHFRSSIVGMALRQTPLIGPYNDAGEYTNPLADRNNIDGIGTLGAVDNPVAIANEDKYTADQGRLFGNAYLQYKILKDLSFRTSIGADVIFNKTHSFLSSKTGRNGSVPPSIPSGSANFSEKMYWINENTLTYNKSINTHDITVLAGYSVEKNDYTIVGVEGNQYPNDNVQYVRAAGVIEGGTEQRSQSSLLSYYGRINYSFNEKYLVTTTIRRDGSSRFGEKNKYGTFPSAAIAWRMSKEDFMKDAKVFSNFKWRLSYGVSGNNDIGNYTYIPNIINSGYTLGNDQHFVNAIYAGSLANTYLTWETTKSVDLGVDIGLLNDRITITTDIYKSQTTGLLLNVNIPAISGFTTTIENIGKVENKGIELSINSKNIVGRFNWNSSFNISSNRNKVLELGGSATDFISAGSYSRTVVGKPMGQFYGRVTAGIFNSQDEINKWVPQDNNPSPGDRRFKDVNHDGKIDNNDVDFIGDPNPKFVFGFNNNFSYKNFDLQILVNGNYGNDIYYNYAVGANLNGNLNQDAVVRGRWHSQDNPGSGNVPRVLFGFTTLADVASDFYVLNGSFLRVSNVTLGYRLKESPLAKINLHDVRFYLSGQNLLTITKYPGYDPEVGASGKNVLAFGIDEGIYPMARILTVGVNVTF